MPLTTMRDKYEITHDGHIKSNPDYGLVVWCPNVMQLFNL